MITLTDSKIGWIVALELKTKLEYLQKEIELSRY